MDVYLMGVYLMAVYLISVHLMGVYLIGVHLIGVYFMGMHLMGVHLMGSTSECDVEFLGLCAGAKRSTNLTLHTGIKEGIDSWYGQEAEWMGNTDHFLSARVCKVPLGGWEVTCRTYRYLAAQWSCMSYLWRFWR
jgi:hypothetical protein